MIKDTLLIVSVVIMAAVLVSAATTTITTRVTVSDRRGECAQVMETSWFGTVMHYNKVVCGAELKKLTDKRRPLHF